VNCMYICTTQHGRTPPVVGPVPGAPGCTPARDRRSSQAMSISNPTTTHNRVDTAEFASPPRRAQAMLIAHAGSLRLAPGRAADGGCWTGWPARSVCVHPMADARLHFRRAKQPYIEAGRTEVRRYCAAGLGGGVQAVLSSGGGRVAGRVAGQEGCSGPGTEHQKPGCNSRTMYQVIYAVSVRRAAGAAFPFADRPRSRDA
jgi:hypothetical protein